MVHKRMPKPLLILAVSLTTCLAAWILFAQGAHHLDLKQSSKRIWRPGTGQPQLVSIEPLPEVSSEGQQCEWLPASASTSLSAELLEAKPAKDTPPTKRGIDVDRAPARVIRDPNPSFSSVAVDPNSDMLVVTDENLFQVLEYGRMDNTPPSAKMTEPKRIIGGNKTKAEMICGVYIDPKTQDTYVVNNDTQNWLAVFSKNAKGNVPPDRFLAVPHGTFGIAVNEETQELYLTVQHDNAVVVYPKTAHDNDKPVRKLAGDDTQLEDPHGIAIDLKRKLMVVANHGNVSYRVKPSQKVESVGSYRGGDEVGEVGGSTAYQPGSGKFFPPSINIYPLDAQGNVGPIRRIQGPKANLNWPAGISIDEERGEIFVSDDMNHAVKVFKITDQGDVAPTRVIAGPKTTIRNPTGVALDTKHNELWVANMGNHSAVVFPTNASGDVAPLRTVRGGPVSEPSLMIGNPGAVAYDSKRKEILVPN